MNHWKKKKSKYDRFTKMTIALGISAVIMETIILTKMNAYVDLQNREGATSFATSSLYNQGGDSVGDSVVDSVVEGEGEGEVVARTNTKMKTGETKTESKTSTSTSISPQKPLQFLHIPKNAGSAITDSAIENGIAWGYCRFQTGPTCPDLPNDEHSNNYIKRLKMTLDKVHKLDLNDTNQYLWHYPPSTLMRMLHNLMDETDDKGTIATADITDPYEDTDLFVVVRNPYDRIISAYYHWETMSHPVEGCNSAGLLNRLVGETFDELEQLGLDGWYSYRSGHYIPQYDFVYDTSRTGTGTDTDTGTGVEKKKKRIVKHILKFENVTQEFKQLVKEYNLNITLMSRKTAIRKRHKKATLTKHDLDEYNRKRIESFYANDFNEFGFDYL